jgi:hypothetical protein
MNSSFLFSLLVYISRETNSYISKKKNPNKGFDLAALDGSTYQTWANK